MEYTYGHGMFYTIKNKNGRTLNGHLTVDAYFYDDYPRSKEGGLNTDQTSIRSIDPVSLGRHNPLKMVDDENTP